MSVCNSFGALRSFLVRFFWEVFWKFYTSRLTLIRFVSFLRSIPPSSIVSKICLSRSFFDAVESLRFLARRSVLIWVIYHLEILTQFDLSAILFSGSVAFFSHVCLLKNDEAVLPTKTARRYRSFIFSLIALYLSSVKKNSYTLP